MELTDEKGMVDICFVIKHRSKWQTHKRSERWNMNQGWVSFIVTRRSHALYTGSGGVLFDRIPIKFTIQLWHVLIPCWFKSMYMITSAV